MRAIYAESSAVLRWLLGQAGGPAIAAALADAGSVVTSALTHAEIARTLKRLEALGQLPARDARTAWDAYAGTARGWSVYAVTDEIIERAGDRFPAEPLRTLDAIHLATAVAYGRDVTPVEILSTDARVRDNAQALGLAVAP
jgi:predicted nucleic acid-binding protein